MKVLLALLGGALLGGAVMRLRASRGAPEPMPAVASGSGDPGPDRVAVDVSAFAD